MRIILLISIFTLMYAESCKKPEPLGFMTTNMTTHRQLIQTIEYENCLTRKKIDELIKAIKEKK